MRCYDVFRCWPLWRLLSPWRPMAAEAAAHAKIIRSRWRTATAMPVARIVAARPMTMHCVTYAIVAEAVRAAGALEAAAAAANVAVAERARQAAVTSKGTIRTTRRWRPDRTARCKAKRFSSRHGEPSTRPSSGGRGVRLFSRAVANSWVPAMIAG